MPTVTIPLVGSENFRGYVHSSNTADQRFVNAMFDVIVNAQTGNKTIYCKKRPGLIDTTGAAGADATALCDAYDLDGFSEILCVASFNSTTATFHTFDSNYAATTLGSLTTAVAGNQVDITAVQLSGVNYFVISVAGNGIYYIGEDGLLGNSTFTGDTHTNTTIDNISSATGLVIGQLISGTGIVAGTRITNISGTTLTVSIATTATNSGITITRERMSKLMDADVPIPHGPVVEMNGYLFVAQDNSQKIFHSDVNSLTSWTATAFISADAGPGILMGVSRRKSHIIGHATTHIQNFYNAGNAVGSVLSPVANGATKFALNKNNAAASSGRNAGGRPFDWINDSIFMVYNGVWLFDDSGIRKISNQVVDRLLTNTPPAELMINAYQFMGRVYVSVMDTGNGSFFHTFDAESVLWSENDYRFGGNQGNLLISKRWGLSKTPSGTTSNGSIYAFPFNVGAADNTAVVYQDGGLPYTITIQTSRINHGTDKRKFVKSVRLVGDNQASGTATLAASDNDYSSFSTLGTFDMTSMDKRITRCGSYKGGRSYRLTHSANTAFRAEALEIEYEVGTS